MRSLEYTDPDELQEVLENGGIAFVASGYASEVIDCLEILNPSVSRRAYFRLLRGYAEYTLGKYQAALAAITEALLKRDELSNDDRQFLTLLKNGCDLQIGSITPDEYIERQANWQQQLEGIYALSQRLEYLRHAILEQNDEKERAKILEQIRSIVGQIIAAPEASEPGKLQARLTLLYAEGQQFLFDFIAEISAVYLYAEIQRPLPPQMIFTRLSNLGQRWSQWRNAMNIAFQEAVKQQYPLMIADALLYHSAIVSTYLADRSIVFVGVGLPVIEKEQLIEDARKMAEQAVQIYQKAGNLEGEIRGKLIFLELFFLEDKKADAQAFATELLPTAQIMNYSGLAKYIEAFVSDQIPLEVALRRTREATSEDNDAIVAAHDDAFMIQGARRFVQSLGLPDDRIPVMERGMLSFRDIARERMKWCMHIDLIEDLTHTRQASTYYKTDPDKHCKCRKHGYESRIGNPDWRIVISAFKRTFCDKCPDREPKNK